MRHGVDGLRGAGESEGKKTTDGGRSRFFTAVEKKRQCLGKVEASVAGGVIVIILLTRK